jgi:hypothetical protein
MKFSLFRFGVLFLILLFAAVLVILNSTHGRFGFEAKDGCACSVSYSAGFSEQCAQIQNNCDGPKFDRLLLLLNYLDFN